MAMAAQEAPDGGGGSSSASSAPPEALEAVAAEWMLEFACSCLCRHFAEQSEAEFWRWRDVAQALISGLSQIPPHQKKTVYVCQLLIRIAQGKSLEIKAGLTAGLRRWVKRMIAHVSYRRLKDSQLAASPWGSYSLPYLLFGCACNLLV